MDYPVRFAQIGDVGRLQSLIRRSGLTLSAPFYTEVQAQAITRFVFGVDTQLILDQTYFCIEAGDELIACGGWSRRHTLFGGDQAKRGAPDPLLCPASDPARVRAFFVAPEFARLGLATRLLDECVDQARRAGFASLELASTLPGEPFYRAHGFRWIEDVDLKLPPGVEVPLRRMRKAI